MRHAGDEPELDFRRSSNHDKHLAGLMFVISGEATLQHAG
jgi:hypothetical protein